MKVVKLASRFDQGRLFKFGLLTLIAVGGSLIYGAALASSFPGWPVSKGAFWITLSSGCGWLVFGPLLWLVTRRPPLMLAEACLVTMAWGELILVPGAGFDWLLLRGTHLDSAWVNASIVGISNVVMACSIVVQLRKVRVPKGKTVAMWILGLDGSGAIFFYIFYRVIFGGRP